ncbi:MAG TPA: hypothetical protein DCR17_01105 [Verrucomicrobiales bacterium]|nr:DUF4956 domain-containing protein [Verrucomicrobiae bacterium]RZO69857.1 MAG: DUF4956 domain-containing protein [Limisphaerales bacterium]HAO65271.1 hypothetical protein [Verrucomicrobiales bacterium]HAR00201.1 hypothetical protein [Verrucomicrobiales bacterium]HAW02515.1 hypothetical protein [Verrucomicrobiales bacterium]|tara:strand:+ start:1423 stop:2106 length:684 start_codon:yes stop_codon:yes gene_type:complete
MEWFLNADFSTSPTPLHLTALGLLLSFLCGHLVAWVYMMTHTGLSYSRTFVQSLMIMPVIVALVMMVLSNNIVYAFGLMAVFAIVRFRNILRDTLDTTYILGVIVIGMGCGTYKFLTATIGCLLICGILVYVWLTGFGSRQRYDMILNMHWSRDLNQIPELDILLRRHALRYVCASQRTHQTQTGTDLSYRLLLRNPNRMHDLLDELKEIEGASRVTGLRSEEESEV